MKKSKILKISKKTKLLFLFGGVAVVSVATAIPVALTHRSSVLNDASANKIAMPTSNPYQKLQVSAHVAAITSSRANIFVAASLMDEPPVKTDKWLKELIEIIAMVIEIISQPWCGDIAPNPVSI